ncbi:hypothetical protein H696_00827 [Fonticula alba]|uniref:ADP-ribosylation factor-like protein 2 n=1 Tax=Fonticula alba TaxID=691883 RepID=A0A058ZH45_FONAL|nr:hypothetical protein H696_00827 [Fonticula alba]KCV73286.1 hypothetical protein H696_00827 [Fonticula alba]|eukprot:XP_009492987.1 hypothetical protein H696_00827 [Fonticula alba]
MGFNTFLSKQQQKEQEICVLVLGLDNAGKTTVTHALLGSDTAGIEPTFGFNIRSHEIDGFTLNIWDVGGQRTLRSFWRNYFYAAEALVWVVDASDPRRLADCRSELSSILQEESQICTTLLILANKQDMPGALPPERVAAELGLGEAPTAPPPGHPAELPGPRPQRQWAIFGCSAHTPAGQQQIQQAFRWLVAEVASRVSLPK